MISNSYYEHFIKFKWLWFCVFLIAPLIGIIDLHQKKRQAIAVKEKEIKGLQEKLTEQSVKINSLYRQQNRDEFKNAESITENINAEKTKHDEQVKS